MSPPPRSPVSDGFVALVELSGLPVGDGVTPKGHPQRNKPYMVVHSVDGGGLDGPGWADPDQIATVPYQVTSVGWRRDQAEQVADRVRALVLARAGSGFVHPVTLAGFVVGERWLEAPGGAIPEGDLWNVHDTYRLAVTPA